MSKHMRTWFDNVFVNRYKAITHLAVELRKLQLFDTVIVDAERDRRLHEHSVNSVNAIIGYDHSFAARHTTLIIHCGRSNLSGGHWSPEVPHLLAEKLRKLLSSLAEYNISVYLLELVPTPLTYDTSKDRFDLYNKIQTTFSSEFPFVTYVPTNHIFVNHDLTLKHELFISYGNSLNKAGSLLLNTLVIQAAMGLFDTKIRPSSIPDLILTPTIPVTCDELADDSDDTDLGYQEIDLDNLAQYDAGIVEDIRSAFQRALTDVIADLTPDQDDHEIIDITGADSSDDSISSNDDDPLCPFGNSEEAKAATKEEKTAVLCEAKRYRDDRLAAVTAEDHAKNDKKHRQVLIDAGNSIDLIDAMMLKKQQENEQNSRKLQQELQEFLNNLDDDVMPPLTDPLDPDYVDMN